MKFLYLFKLFSTESSAYKRFGHSLAESCSLCVAWVQCIDLVSPTTHAVTSGHSCYPCYSPLLLLMLLLFQTYK